jgi:CheY-like chemotaxis protein
MFGKTILVVDDLVENTNFINCILKKNYKILMANNGMDALVLAENETLDLIILDIEMPEMNGFEVCKRLKDNDNTKYIPIIFVSGLSDKQYIQKALQLGAVDYLTKPFTLDNLKEIIRNHLK